uniref:Very-long-chain enoyl-CoA reductase n=1 Tax=Phasianus colchicus TaxID=9054 RepID=A0A669QBQ0_PHACC
MKHYEVEILDAKTREKLCFLDKVEPQATIAEIKNLFTKTHPQWYPARQSLRLDPKGRSLKDEDILQSLPVGTTATFYFRDLGAQISWVTVSSCLSPSVPLSFCLSPSILCPFAPLSISCPPSIPHSSVSQCGLLSLYPSHVLSFVLSINMVFCSPVHPSSISLSISVCLCVCPCPYLFLCPYHVSLSFCLSLCPFLYPSHVPLPSHVLLSLTVVLCPSVHPSDHPFIHPSVHPMSLCLSVHQRGFVFLSIPLSFPHFSVSLSIPCPSVPRSIPCPSVRPSVLPSIALSIPCSSICPCVPPSLSPSICPPIPVPPIPLCIPLSFPTSIPMSPAPPPSPPCLSVRPQVFLTEYAGPLLIYLLFYFRVPFLYGPRYDFTASRHAVVQCVRGSWGVLEEVWGAIKGPEGGNGCHWMGLGSLKRSLGEERGPGGVLRVLEKLKGTTGRSWKGFQGSFGGVLG